MRTTRPITLAALLCALASTVATAQLPTPPSDTLDPSIVALMPGEIIIARALRKEMSKSDRTVREKVKKEVAGVNEMIARLRAHPEELAKLDAGDRQQYEDLPEQMRSVMKGVNRVGFAGTLAHYSVTYIRYQLNERAPNTHVTFTGDSSMMDPEALAAIARRTHTRYVLTYPMLRLDVRGKVPYGILRGALFDSQSGRFLFDTTIITDSQNHGFEFTCSREIECAVTNGVAAFAPVTVRAVLLNTPKVQYAIELARVRSAALFERYYGRPCSPSLLAMLPSESPRIDPSDIYACFANDDTTKIVALAARQVSRTMLEDFEKDEHPEDQNVTMEGDFNDTAMVYNVYAFIVTGARVDGRWYFAKQAVTYFADDSLEAGRRTYFDRLQRYNFFVPGGIDRSPAFWETGLFAKVTDPRLDHEYDSTSVYYQDLYESEKEYIGMIRFVADRMRRERAEVEPMKPEER